jgi:hypothetical protein
MGDSPYGVTEIFIQNKSPGRIAQALLRQALGKFALGMEASDR